MGTRRVFTLEEEKYILENWGKVSCHQMRIVLNCSHEALLRIAEQHHLEIPKSNRWTEEEVSALKKLAFYKNVKEISEILGKSKHSITTKAGRLGVTFYQGKRDWTEEEELKLRRLWGTKRIELISKEMNRSVPSLKVRAQRLKLGRMYGNDGVYLTIPMIVKMLNVSNEKIMRTWIKMGLEVETRKLSSQKSYYCVSWGNLIKFLKSHLNEWDSRNLEMNAFGEEFDWLVEKRKKDKEENPLWYRRWTEVEIDEVKWLLLVEKKNYHEIAKILNRKEGSVARIIRELGLQYRLPQYWKGEELLFLKNYCGELSYLDMANHLGRSERAVKTKVYQMGYHKNKKKDS